MARTGRRRGGADTRGDILSAARAAFAENGYQATTIRAVAAAAGVDPALVHHYFGDKESLFAAVVELPFPPSSVAERIMDGGIEAAGENAVRLFLSVWETPASRDAIEAMLRGAFTTEHGADTLREFFETVLVSQVAPHIPHPDADLRTTLVASHLVGVAMLRYIIGFEALRRATPDDLVNLIAPRIQAYLTGEPSG